MSQFVEFVQRESFLPSRKNHNANAFVLHLDPTFELPPIVAPLMQNVSAKSKDSLMFSLRGNWGIFQHPSKVTNAIFRLLHRASGYKAILQNLLTLFELLTVHCSNIDH